MTKEEIEQSEIVKAIYINGKWKVGIKLEEHFYSFRIEGNSDMSKEDLLDNVFKNLLETEKKQTVQVEQPVIMDDIKGLAPVEKSEKQKA
jgi:hypothetical protein